MISKETLREMEKLAQAATPGPWIASGCKDGYMVAGPTICPGFYHEGISKRYWHIYADNGEKVPDLESGHVHNWVSSDDLDYVKKRFDQAVADYEFIAASRELVPELIAEVIRLRQESEGYTLLVSQYHRAEEPGGNKIKDSVAQKVFELPFPPFIGLSIAEIDRPDIGGMFSVTLSELIWNNTLNRFEAEVEPVYYGRNAGDKDISHFDALIAHYRNLGWEIL